MSDEDGSQGHQTAFSAMEPSHLQCHVLDSDDETMTLCGLSGRPLLLFLSDDIDVNAVNCPICKRRLHQEAGLEKAHPFSSSVEVVPLLAIFGLSSFLSTIFLSVSMSFLIGLLSVLAAIPLMPSKER